MTKPHTLAQLLPTVSEPDRQSLLEIQPQHESRWVELDQDSSEGCQQNQCNRPQEHLHRNDQSTSRYSHCHVVKPTLRTHAHSSHRPRGMARGTSSDRQSSAQPHLGVIQERHRAVPQEVEVVVIPQGQRVQRIGQQRREEGSPQQQRRQQELDHCRATESRMSASEWRNLLGNISMQRLDTEQCWRAEAGGKAHRTATGRAGSTSCSAHRRHTSCGVHANADQHSRS